MLVKSLNLEINCEKFTVKAGSFILTNEDADLSLLYEECKSLAISGLPTKEELPCHVSDVAGGKPELLHLSLSALLLPIEFAGGGYGVLLEKIVGIVNFLSGTGCPMPLKTVVKGEVCAEIKLGTNETVEPLIALSDAIQQACPQRPVLEGLETGAGVKDQLLYGAHEAFIDGTATLKLTGDHEDFTLGVLLK